MLRVEYPVREQLLHGFAFALQLSFATPGTYGKPGFFDSPGDQRAIKVGYFSAPGVYQAIQEKAKEQLRVLQSEVFDGPK